MGWFRNLSISQKFLVSFGFILTLLALSLTALLFYLARINSYVDRHKRITVPAIVTAASMQREAYDLKLVLHLRVQRNSAASVKDTPANSTTIAQPSRLPLTFTREYTQHAPIPFCTGC